jgi:hypothetical protein
MKVLRNSFTASMMALCLLAPTVASAEDANSLRTSCVLSHNTSNLQVGTGSQTSASGSLVKVFNASNDFKQRFWLRVYSQHSSNLGRTIKLIQMSNGLCYRRPDGDLEQFIRVGACNDSKAEWISDPLGNGMYSIRSTTNTNMVWTLQGTGDGSYVTLSTAGGHNSQKWRYSGCMNMNNVSASPL